MKKFVVGTFTVGGGVAGIETWKLATGKLVKMAADAVIPAGSLPMWVANIIDDVFIVGHVAGGCALGHATGDWLAKKF